MSERTVQRFTGAERVFHWVYFVAFAVLAVTGFVLLWPWTPFSVGEAGQTNRLLHRIFGVLLMVAPVVIFLASRRGFLADLREGFRWGRDDWRSFGVMLRRTYWTNDTTGLPPQGKFMPGQKFNIIAQTLLFFVLAATGLVLWLAKGAAPAWVMLTMIVLHSLAAIGATVVVIIHIYMVTTLPYTRGAIGSMFTGRMSEDLAQSHHPRWRP
jgi:formate dehydrogenase gamma subunit